MIFPFNFYYLVDKLKDETIYRENFTGGDNSAIIRQTRKYSNKYLVYVEEIYAEGVHAWLRIGRYDEMGDENEEINYNSMVYFDIWDYDKVCREFKDLFCPLNSSNLIIQVMGGYEGLYRAKYVPEIPKPSSANPPHGYMWYYSFSHSYDTMEDGTHIYYPLEPKLRSDIKILLSNGDFIDWIHGKSGLTWFIRKKYHLT